MQQGVAKMDYIFIRFSISSIDGRFSIKAGPSLSDTLYSLIPITYQPINQLYIEVGSAITYAIFVVFVATYLLNHDFFR